MWSTKLVRCPPVISNSHNLKVLIRSLADVGLSATRRQGIIGVWVGPNKIAALGARLQRGVTYHGFALNVNPVMEHFDYIIPCGITDGGVTSIARETGRPISMTEVRTAVELRFAELFGVQLQPVSLEHLETQLPDLPSDLAMTDLVADVWKERA